MSVCTVTGTNLHFITPIVCIVCIFYTTLVSCTKISKSTEFMEKVFYLKNKLELPLITLEL